MANTKPAKSILPASIVALAKRVVTQSAAAGRKIAVAESCTGGLVSAALTEIAGSSAVFEYGFVTYANEAKIDTLGVNGELIEAFGAVSVATAWAMAMGALEKSGADVAVAVSGIAGPSGGSDDKPVGTIVFALAQKGQDPEDVFAEVKQLGSNLSRSEIRLAATRYALELLLPSS
jgi:nicotinamide-nucleotide amidase